MLANVLRQFGLGRMAHNTVLSTFWQFARITGQSLWVIAIARSLGPSDYGIFAGVAGLATTLGGLVGLGTGFLMLQNVSRNRGTFGIYWLKAKLTTLLSGLILVPLFTGIAYLIVKRHVTLEVIAAIGISELVCYPMVYMAAFAFQAHERLGLSGLLTAIMSGMRLSAVLIFWFTATTRDLETYAWFHLAASIFGAVCAITMVNVVLRPPGTRYALYTKEVQEGLSFSAIWFTGNALTELDKTLALRLAGSEAAGIYSIAYRLASALTLPIASLALAAQPRLFRDGTDQAEAHPHLVRHLTLIAVGYGLVASVVLLLLASLLPLVLGQAFEPAARAARLLVLVPPLYALRLIGNTVLMTIGRQIVRALIEVPGIVLLIGLALLWMPQYGIRGIAMTVTTTEALLAIAVWSALWIVKRKQQSIR